MRSERPESLKGVLFKTNEIKIGDFIGIDSWTTLGCVFDIQPSYIGGDSAVDVHMQIDPCSDDTKVFRIEDGQFWIEG